MGRAVGSVHVNMAAVDCGGVLQKHQKLEDMKMAEDQRQTTRLADAFKQDALRQSAFKNAMLSSRAAEKKQQMITLARRQQQDKEVEDAVSARKSSLTFKKQASISQLTALENSLLRANPELENLRPRGGDDTAGGASSGQTLTGNFGDHTVQNAEKVLPPSPCCKLRATCTLYCRPHTDESHATLPLKIKIRGRASDKMRKFCDRACGRSHI